MTALDLADKKDKNKKNFKRLIQVVLLIEVTSLMMDHKVI